MAERIFKINEYRAALAMVAIPSAVMVIGIFLLVTLGNLGFHSTYCQPVSGTNVELDISTLALQEITPENINQLRRLKTIDLNTLVDGGDFIQFTPDGRYLVITTPGMNYSPWTIMLEVMKPGYCYISLGKQHLVAFSPDGDYMLTRGEWFGVGPDYQLVQLSPVRHLATFDRAEYAAFVELPEGDRLMFRNADEEDSRMWNLETNSEWSPAVTQPTRNARQFSFDYEYFIATPLEDLMSIWNTDNASREIDLETDEGRSCIRNLTTDEGNNSCEHVLEKLNKDKTIIATTLAGQISFVDIEDGTILSILSFDNNVVHDVAFSPDGTLVAVGLTEQRGLYSYGVIEFWGVPDGGE